MKLLLALCLAAILAVAQGCGKETVKRVTYDTMQNLAQQACLRNPHADCSDRESYDDYQRKRKELEKGDDQ